MSNIMTSKYYISKNKNKVLIGLYKENGEFVIHIVDVNNGTVSTAYDEDIQNTEWSFINSLDV